MTMPIDEASGRQKTSSAIDLLRGWIQRGPVVAVLQGFSGVGKTAIVRELIASVNIPTAYVVAAEAGLGFEDLLFEIASELESAGHPLMADSLEGDLLDAFDKAMRTECLVVIDDFAKMIDSKEMSPSAELYLLLKRLGSRITSKARLLLVTDQKLAFAQSLELPIITLGPPGDDQAINILNDLLASRDLEDEIPVERRSSVVQWVGNNPRALQALVACLEEDSLDELIALQPESWDVQSREFTPILIRQLEAAFWDRVMTRLEAATLLLLEYLSVYRKPFKKEAIGRLSEKLGPVDDMRSDLSSLFLLEQSRGWYSLNPVARELARIRLLANERRIRDAHSVAADHFLRHFTARGRSDLISRASEFVEARYHSILANREQDFQSVAAIFRSFLLQNLSRITKVPPSSQAARQAASLLIAALGDQERGNTQMHYVLAKILESFNTSDDDILALRHATLACRSSSNFQHWILRVRLTARLDTFSATSGVLRQAASSLQGEALAHVYFAAIKMWISRGASHSELVSLLNEGLARCGRADTAWVLSQLASVVLSGAGRHTEAIDHLMAHIEEAPSAPNSNLIIEHAVLLAYALGDKDKLRWMRGKVYEKFESEEAAELIGAFVHLLSHEFDVVSSMSFEKTRVLMGCQIAFAELCQNRPIDAYKVLRQVRITSSSSYWRAYVWLKSLLQFVRGHEEPARVGIESYLGSPITMDDSESMSLAIWLEAWDQPTGERGQDAAFVFPRIPAEVTGLGYDIVRLQSDSSVLDLEALAHLRSIRPMVADEIFDSQAMGDEPPQELRAETDETHFKAANPTVVNVINLDQSGAKMGNADTGDTYNVEQAGAVGKNASAPNATFIKGSGQPSVDLQTLSRELDELRAALRERPSSPENDLALAEVSRASIAAKEGDQEGVVSHLRAAGKWAWEAANNIGAAIAATVIAKALGLQ